ncbi:hypothetical protein BCR39DRAFT_511770 [Naematelia encephala]|uniref:Peptidase M20 dimerisation domain-containing protein n=1 Tax=Naematelia encephala TaxID=71784 RepID=A0A1Y2BLY6_9TREE|nr:hypothetical protein BCR39DRAFT_511770 [Naematelia encephala]
MGSSTEKPLLPESLPTETPAKRTTPWRKPLFIAISAFVILRFALLPIFFPWLRSDLLSNHYHHHRHDLKSGCEQGQALFPKSLDVSELIPGKEAQIRDWLSGAVKIPTEIFDVMGEIGEDPRWDVFYEFADYLEKSFPLVHKHLTKTRVMTHALVFEWQGSDPSLQPILLTGHQDVVPVLNATRGLWTHDPFGGEYDPETDLIWGRGSSDDKSGTIGALSAIELLLESGKFKPTRTVVLAFGIDEETGGKVGALNLGIWLEEKYGKDSFAILVDEGSGLYEAWGQVFATPAVGEKGYLDVEVKVETLGGHSSVPPPHTGIGLLALAIAQIEKHPHEPYLNPESPLVGLMSCGAEYASDFPLHLKKAVHKVEESLSYGGTVNKKALKEIEDYWVYGSAEDGSLVKGMGRAFVSTTQAVDIVNGGVKVNALPEVVTAIVNHRISLAESVAELQKHLIDTLSPIAKHYNLSLEAFGKDVQLKGCHHQLTDAKAGKLILSEAFHSALDPAPVSPHSVDSAAWRLLSGAVKAVYSTRPDAKDDELEANKDIIMAPLISTGNTDTKRYWNLTRNIYRFAYQVTKGGGLNNVHTVDEHIQGQTFVEQVRWFMHFIVLADEDREL